MKTNRAAAFVFAAGAFLVVATSASNADVRGDAPTRAQLQAAYDVLSQPLLTPREERYRAFFVARFGHRKLARFGPSIHALSRYLNGHGRGTPELFARRGAETIPNLDPDTSLDASFVVAAQAGENGYDENADQLAQLKAALDGNPTTASERNELVSMRLQMAMDRRSKFVEMLSNLMKKIDSTQETIVQNLKG